MPWKKKEQTVEEKRREFAEKVVAQAGSKRALCEEYGISRPTGDKWIKRYEESQSMSDRSRAPHKIPSKTAEEIEEEIVALRRRYPAIGAQKLHIMLTRKGVEGLPCARTVNNILKRRGLITPEASRAATPNKRFEKELPNEMWQADYKGHFEMKDKTRCHPLNILDDCSRFNLCCDALASETLEEIQPVLIRLFKEYGLPISFLCDNGNPWGTVQSMGYTRFEVWLMELGVLTLHGRIRHPQTQGKEERFNGSLTREFLNYRTFLDLPDAQRQLQEYRAFYNNERPHSALGMKVPSEVYVKSERRMPSEIREWEYPSNWQVRTIKNSGYLTYGGQGYFLSEAFAGKQVPVELSEDGRYCNLYFRQFRIGRIDREQRVFTFKKAYLIHNDPRNRPVAP